MDATSHENLLWEIREVLDGTNELSAIYPSRQLSRAIIRLEEALLWAKDIKVDTE